jgi:Trp operon repressor
MSKLKIEHGASKINLVLLKTNIEDSISQDIELMATWSDNDRKYIVNELLRFALAQEEDFQKYKASVAANIARPVSSAKPVLSPDKSSPVAASKSVASSTPHA